jgi:hypothetical protein
VPRTISDIGLSDGGRSTMEVKVQVVPLTNDGQEITREVACVERQDLTPTTLCLSLGLQW